MKERDSKGVPQKILLVVAESASSCDRLLLSPCICSKGKQPVAPYPSPVVARVWAFQRKLSQFGLQGVGGPSTLQHKVKGRFAVQVIKNEGQLYCYGGEIEVLWFVRHWMARGIADLRSARKI